MNFWKKILSTVFAVALTAGAAHAIFTSPGVIARDSQWTIVIVDTSQNGGVTDVYCELPAGTDLGDVVEVQYINNGGNAPVTVAPSGEQLTGITPIGGCKIYRKIDSVTWGHV